MASRLLTRRCMRSLAWLVVLSACAPSPLAGIDVDTARVERLSVPLQARPELDLVFVVDTSPAMLPHRDTVLANARSVIAVLRNVQGGLPNVHIGIVTADVGTRGALDDRSDPHGDCTEDGDAGVMRAARIVNGNYLVDEHDALGTRQNFAGSLEDAFAASLAEAVTANGCSFSRPLEAMRRALVTPFNPQFLRSEAPLAVIFITPRDDCSFAHASFVEGGNCDVGPLVGVSEYATAARAAKPDPRDLVVSGVFGPASPVVVVDGVVQPSCTTGTRSAQPAVRLQAFLDEFPGRNTATTLCQDDLTGGIPLWGGFEPHVGDPCLERVPLDVDPAPGLQPDCRAWLEDRGSDTVAQTLLAPCTDAPAGPCWEILTDASACPMPPALMFHTRGVVSTMRHPINAILECVVE